MLNVFINEMLCFQFLCLAGYLIKRLSKARGPKAVIPQLSACVATVHFLVGLSLSLRNSGEVWFPFLIDVDAFASRASYDYDVGNLIIVLAVLYVVNGGVMLWAGFAFTRSMYKKKVSNEGHYGEGGQLIK